VLIPSENISGKPKDISIVVGQILHWVDRDLFCAAAMVIAINDKEEPGLMIFAPSGFIPIAPGLSKHSESVENGCWHTLDECPGCKRIKSEYVPSRIKLH